jgi:hypothetical protein
VGSEGSEEFGVSAELSAYIRLGRGPDPAFLWRWNFKLADMPSSQLRSRRRNCPAASVADHAAMTRQPPSRLGPLAKVAH